MKVLGFLIALAMVMGFSPVVSAQYDLYFDEDVEGRSGGEAILTVGLDIDEDDGEPVEGYQWGICHDEDLLTLEEDDVVLNDDDEDDDGLDCEEDQDACV